MNWPFSNFPPVAWTAKQIEALKLALEALEDAQYFIEAELNDRIDLYKNYPNLAHKYAGEQESLRKNQDAITAVKEALSELEQDDEVLGFNGWGFPIEKPSQPEQEPVAYCNGMPAYEGPLSKTQRKEPEQEPVATLDDLEQEIYENTRQFVSRDVMEWMLKRYYTTPPQRKPLTDEEIGAILEGVNAYGTRLYTFARAIEAAHGIKEKNT